MRIAEHKTLLIVFAMMLALPMVMAANPDANVNSIEGVAVAQAGKYFGYSRDANLLIGFTVIDADQDDMNFNAWYGASAGAKTTALIEDFNLSSQTTAPGGTTYPARCDTNDSSAEMTCTYDFNISGALVADGNWFITIDVNSGAAGETPDTNSFARSFVVDNNAGSINFVVANNTVLTSNSKVLEMDLNDSLAGVASSTVVVNGKASDDFSLAGSCTASDANYVCSYTEGERTIGTQQITATNTDRSGNNATSTVTYHLKVFAGTPAKTLTDNLTLFVGAGIVIVLVGAILGFSLGGFAGLAVGVIAMLIMLIVIGNLITL